MQTIEEILVGHHLAYHFLSKTFYEPPQEAFVHALVSNQLFEDWPLESDDGESRIGLALLREFCRSWEAQTFGQLQREYTRLFIGPEHLLVPLWESVYRNPKHLLFEEETLQVRQQYLRFGMGIPNLYSEPDDHLGLELRFVAYLSRLALAAIEQDRQDTLNITLSGMRSFLDNHLLLWANDCLHDVLKYSDNLFYTGVAHLTLGCLAHTDVTLRLEMKHESGQACFNG